MEINFKKLFTKNDTEIFVMKFTVEQNVQILNEFIAISSVSYNALKNAKPRKDRAIHCKILKMKN